LKRFFYIVDMKNIYYLLLIAIAFVCNLACSNDDNAMGQNGENSSPSEFTIDVDTLSFDMVTLSWTQPEGVNNENLEYSVLLDNSLVAENLSSPSHTLVDLNVATGYQIQVIAENSVGEVAKTIDLETLDTLGLNFFIKKLTTSSVVFDYMYDDTGNLIKREDSSEFGLDYEYRYNTNGDLIEEQLRGFNTGSSADFTYEAGQLVDCRMINYLDGYNFDFVSPDLYNVYYLPEGSDPENSTITLQRSEGKISSYERKDISTDEIVEKLQFTYADGNMTKIVDEITNIEWTFEFDDKNYYGIQKGHLTKTGPSDNFSGGANLYLQWLYIPGFNNFSNKNNMTRVFKNGNLFLKYEYEYYVFDYPSKVYVNDNPEPMVLTYGYR